MSATRFLAGALACAFVLLCAGCATGPKPLYTWESFPQQQYKSGLREVVWVDSPDFTAPAACR